MLNKFVECLFSVYSIKKQMFFLARDQFGIKPLIIFLIKKGFFASEIKSLKFLIIYNPMIELVENFDKWPS